MAAKPIVDTVQRSRLCVFEDETSTVMVSASVVATIIARIEGDFSATLAPGIPVFWLPAEEIVKVVGEPSWDAVIHRLGFSLVGISFAEWTDERVLATVRAIFPTAELQKLND